MSKKQLNENTIRRFMKLASIDPLTENFLEDIKENEEEITEGEEEITEGEDETIEENQANVVPDNGQLKEEELEDEDAMEPMGDPEMAPAEEPMEGKMIDLDKFMAAFEEALEAQGFPTETELGDEEAPAPEMAPEPEEEPEEDPEDLAPAARMYEELLDDAGVEVIDEDKIVSEVVRRVAKRLVKSKLNK
tara:strand:- start:765 stop:1337 length:573 start_codon:yes stop_codon:yes gene_type:complete